MEEVKTYKYYDSVVVKILYGRISSNQKVTVDSDGFLHSFDDNPASVYSQEKKYVKINNILKIEYWYKHGYRHRLTGPGYMLYTGKGLIDTKLYYIHGKELCKEQWEVEANRLLMLNEI